MVKILFMISLTIGLLCLSKTMVFAQDAIYYEHNYYSGTAHSMYIGDHFRYVSGGDDNGGSFVILNPNAAIKIIMLDPVNGDAGPYKQMFLYADSIIYQPFIAAGTSQYCEHNLEVRCFRKGELPEPNIFVPIDRSDISDTIPNYQKPLPLISGKRMLILRKAFFWENSEDTGGWTGPYANIVINTCNPIVAEYSYVDLVNDPNLWLGNGRRYDNYILPGPIWWADPGFFEPTAYNEWIDGPWGCVYSNMAIHNWDDNNPSKDKVAVIVSEADDSTPEDMMGLKVISKNTEGPIVMKVRMFGWLILQNVTVGKDVPAPEPSVANSDYYWYGGWDGAYPENMRGPHGSHDGSQYYPMTNSEYWSFISNPSHYGLTIGLLGGVFPKMTLSNKMIYKAADKPAIFGASSATKEESNASDSNGQ
jgi:hypothetical protein